MHAHRTTWVFASVLFVVFAPAPARAAQPGFTEDFATGTGGFFSFSMPTHATSGGVGGAADGFLLIGQTDVSRLGARNDTDPFIGDLIADHVGGFSFWLKDVGAVDNLEIHVGVGRSFENVWLSVQGFHPTAQWQQFSVDITDPSGWVQILGTEPFEAALHSGDRLLFRHDFAPLESSPDLIAGDFGIDRVSVLADEPPGGPVPEASSVSFVLTSIGVLVIGVLALRGRHAPSAGPGGTA